MGSYRILRRLPLLIQVLIAILLYIYFSDDVYSFLKAAKEKREAESREAIAKGREAVAKAGKAEAEEKQAKEEATCKVRNVSTPRAEVDPLQSLGHVAPQHPAVVLDKTHPTVSIGPIIIYLNLGTSTQRPVMPTPEKSPITSESIKKPPTLFENSVDSTQKKPFRLITPVLPDPDTINEDVYDFADRIERIINRKSPLKN